METIFYVLIAILATAGTYTIVKIIYYRLVIIEDQIKIKRKRIARIDILWNSVKHMDKQLSDIGKKTDTHQKTLNNIDREMDVFHKRIVKDFKALLSSKTNQLTKRLDIAFRRLNEMSASDTPYSTRVDMLEEKQKVYDTSLHTQALMIGDLQKTQGIQNDRFKKVMDLKKIKVKE